MSDLTISSRFKDLKKLPKAPARRLLAEANMKLDAEVKTPAAADVPTLMTELDDARAPIDMLRVMAAAMPIREATWWACLSARDIVGPDDQKAPATLLAAEAWVFDPTEENMHAAFSSLELAEFDDPTKLCSACVIHSDGKLGPGELAEHDAPAGVVPLTAFCMVLDALGQNPDIFESQIQLVIDRALDIARGGNGKVAASG